MCISVLGIDIGKNSFHFFDNSASGQKAARKKMPRHKLLEYIATLEPCTIAMEACAGAHFLARTFEAHGHTVKLIAPQYVKPFVKTNKNDYNDAEAISEAAMRPNMRFVPIKSSEQQSIQLLHRVRSGAVKQRTEIVNEARAALLEEGITIAQGIEKVRSQLPRILEDAENGLCPPMRTLVADLHERIQMLDKSIKGYDQQVIEIAEADEDCQRLQTIPGIGPLTATAIKMSMGEAENFTSGRHFAAWLGLVPRQVSTGGKPKLLGISKRGNPYLRTLLIHGARAVLYCVKNESDKCKKWVMQLNHRKHGAVATVGLANKLARIAWALMSQKTVYSGTAM